MGHVEPQREALPIITLQDAMFVAKCGSLHMAGMIDSEFDAAATPRRRRRGHVGPTRAYRWFGVLLGKKGVVAHTDSSPINPMTQQRYLKAS